MTSPSVFRSNCGASIVRTMVTEVRGTPTEVRVSTRVLVASAVTPLFELAPTAMQIFRAALAASRRLRFDSTNRFNSVGASSVWLSLCGVNISTSLSSGTRTGISDDPYGSQISTTGLSLLHIQFVAGHDGSMVKTWSQTGYQGDTAKG